MEDTLLRYSAPVPRYTSYPTAPHFSAAVTGEVYAGWLREIRAGDPLSLYFHVPFCRELCWFCGCQTTVARDPAVPAAYAGLLADELSLVAGAAGGRGVIRHLHWGGGTPTAIGADGLRRVMEAARTAFDFAADAELAIEVDPRTLREEAARTLGALGFNRASLGVQDLDASVQQRVNRIQPLDVTRRAADWLRAAGMTRLNIDLMVGLPGQTEAGVRATVAEALAALAPDRVTVFAYAHVPWMKRHQRLIAEADLPGPRERLRQAQAAAAVLAEAGYAAIGLDHFARHDDPLLRAARGGRLRRNFQGYTDDPAATLIGIGASAIGSLPQGYAQNAHHVPEYRDAIEAGRFAVTRGIALSKDDRMRREVIERLMCDLEVDLGEVLARWDEAPDTLAGSIAALAPLQDDGLVAIDGDRISVSDAGRQVVRTICAAFDRYLAPGIARHASGI